ncbi:hypothetical protein EDC96DRAFT_604710 [Choanephora cucurbitarum]|nr:hypothetical protein EDC96DRAFT_604710 [Choanephora cucurbitarum]
MSTLLVSSATATGTAVVGNNDQGFSMNSPSRASRVIQPQSNYIASAPSVSRLQPSTSEINSSPFDLPSYQGVDNSYSTGYDKSCARELERISEKINQLSSAALDPRGTDQAYRLMRQATNNIVSARSVCCSFFQDNYAKDMNAKRIDYLEDFVDDLKDWVKPTKGYPRYRNDMSFQIESLLSSLKMLKDCID